MVINSERIIFLDIIRAIAVFLMLEGHTIHALLRDDLRVFDSTAYWIWNSIRGFTAPIFMFTAGTVFAYLLHKKGDLMFRNPRVKKGIKRVILLISVGYFLRFPTFRPSQFSDISDRQWQIFFSVDALHLIGIGLFLIILLKVITELTKFNPAIIYLITTLFFIFFTPIVRSIHWVEYVPMALASYLTIEYGSIFPLFPWVCYMTAGAAFGYYLFGNYSVRKNKVALHLVSAGIFSLLIAWLFNFIENNLAIDSGFWSNHFSMSFWRLGVVLILNAVVVITSYRVHKLPEVIKLFGRHSLSIYVVHLIIIYGSALIPGLSYSIGNTLNVVQCILVVLLLSSTMLLMAYLIELYNKYSWKIVSFIKLIFKRILPGTK
ncbi:MAG: DUF1624 domain-containing protein [Melioribacteraceae bacterium]|nr:DUF1624 domain-containing protein [Melioribacteraceae bacterium]